MTFSEALNAIKMGSKVSRESWRGLISYWFIDNGEIYEMQADGRVEKRERILTANVLAEDWYYVP